MKSIGSPESSGIETNCLRGVYDRMQQSLGRSLQKSRGFREFSSFRHSTGCRF
jgi:hypothetical protein